MLLKGQYNPFMRHDLLKNRPYEHLWLIIIFSWFSIIRTIVISSSSTTATTTTTTTTTNVTSSITSITTTIMITIVIHSIRERERQRGREPTMYRSSRSTTRPLSSPDLESTTYIS